MMPDGLLIAVQWHRCSKCNRREEVSQTLQATFGDRQEQPRFAVRLPFGWQTVNGKSLCSVACARALLEAE